MNYLITIKLRLRAVFIIEFSSSLFWVKITKSFSSHNFLISKLNKQKIIQKNHFELLKHFLQHTFFNIKCVRRSSMSLKIIKSHDYKTQY